MGYNLASQDPFAISIEDRSAAAEQTAIELPRERAEYECIVRTCTTGQYQRPAGSGITRRQVGAAAADLLKLELAVEVVAGPYAGARVWTDLPLSATNQRDYEQLPPGVQSYVQAGGTLLDRIIYVFCRGRIPPQLDLATIEARVRLTLAPDRYEVQRADRARAEGKRGKLNPLCIVDVLPPQSAAQPAQPAQPTQYAAQPAPAQYAAQPAQPSQYTAQPAQPQMRRAPSRPVAMGQSMQNAEVPHVSVDDTIPF